MLPVASNSQKSSAKIGSSNNLPTNSIPSSNKDVNTTKYSMQEPENNADSFNLPKDVNNTNPTSNPDIRYSKEGTFDNFGLVERFM